MLKITDTEKLANIVYDSINNLMKEDALDILRPLLTAWKKEIVDACLEQVMIKYKIIHKDLKDLF